MVEAKQVLPGFSQKEKAEVKVNPMKEIRVEKITLNMGIGPEPEELKKAEAILQRITERKPVKTKAKVRQPTWGLRPGIPIGVKVTLRKKKAVDFLKNAFAAKENRLSKGCFDVNGNFGFGIQEYIDLPGTKYDPKLGIKGLDVLVTLERPGYSIKKKKLSRHIGKKHLISRNEAMNFIKGIYGVELE